MKYLKPHFTLFLLMIWGLSFAQQHTNYSIKNGLPSNHIYRITQDYEGFIWFITNKGISKFDGKTFKNFTIKNGLPSNDIWQIRITPDNKIWYFTKANKLGYILKDKVFAFSSKSKNVLYPRIILQTKNSITFNDGNLLYTLKDTIWQTTPNLTLNNKFLVAQKVIHPNINYHSVNNNGDSLFFHKKETLKGVSIKKRILKRTLQHNQINDSLYINVGKQRYTLENFNSESVQTFSYTSQNLPPNLKYFRTHNVNNHIQYTGMDFVSYLGPNGGLKNTVHIPKKLNAHFSFIDKTGNIWSATFNKGVFMLPKKKQQVAIIGKNKKTQQLEVVKNKIYTGIYKEGFFLIRDSLKLLTKNNGFQYSITYIDTLKTTFFSSEYNLHAYKNKKTTLLNLFKEPLNKNTFVRKLIHFKGALYGNNAFGIIKISLKNFTPKKEYQLNGISSFSKTKTQLFTGNQSGLFLLKNDAFIKLNEHSLFNKPVLCQSQLNNDHVVVGTDGYGAYITNGKKATAINNSKKYNVQNIFIDINKNIWLATQKGVHKVIKQQNEYIIKQSFYESDGLLSNNVNCIAIKNDSLYVGTDIGISIISLQEKPINQLQKIYIKSVFANGVLYTGDTITLPYKSNGLLSASFGSINLGKQQNLTYQYKLEPIQKNWITTNIPEINFTSLKPNTYYLSLKVSNHHQNQKTKTIIIKITPLWWQTIGFKIGFVLLGIIGFYLFNKWVKKNSEENIRKSVIKKQKEVENELYALRSQMNPHFVFNSLNAIQYYMTKNELELSEIYLVKFSCLIRMFFDFSREKHITLEQEILLLRSYLEIEKMRFGNDFKFHFNIDETLSLDTKIPSMLLQPILENAVNHGIFHQKGKGIINIILKKSTIKNEFIIAIKDNGIGIIKSKEIQKKSIKNHTSKSTQIIADRIKLINESLQWEISQKIIDLTSENSTGTLVQLTFRKNKNDKSNSS